EPFLDLSQLAQATVIDSISMNFYIVKPDSRLQMFNFYRGKFLPKYCGIYNSRFIRSKRNLSFGAGFRLLAALRVAIYLKKWKITAVMALIIKELCVYLQS
ncbi:MAG: hypothetical protein PUB91_07795, partial [Bacteroidales bacterium]|nr:hypothetical protein [Bacteroidales bacterium]